MRRGTGIVVMRSVVAALVLVLGVMALASGRIVVGLVLVALATTNVILTVTIRRRRARLLERFPGLARTVATNRAGTTATVPVPAPDR